MNIFEFEGETKQCLGCTTCKLESGELISVANLPSCMKFSNPEDVIAAYPEVTWCMLRKKQAQLDSIEALINDHTEFLAKQERALKPWIAMKLERLDAAEKLVSKIKEVYA